MILASHLARAVDDLVPPDRPLMLHAYAARPQRH